MTLTIPEADMSSLRQAAEAAEEATGPRAEIIRGVLMTSPTPRGKHAGVVSTSSPVSCSLQADELPLYGEASARRPDGR